MAKIWLLTHSTELLKPTNTGRLVVTASKENSIDDISNEGSTGFEVQVVKWQRKLPDEALLQAIQQKSVLIYPSEHATEISCNNKFANDINHIEIENNQQYSFKMSDCQHFLLLDATWQLAQKMFNQSPYLKLIPHVKFIDTPKSAYRLRRNQREQGLCTAEVVQLLLDFIDEPAHSQRLALLFAEFNRNNHFQLKPTVVTV